MDKNFEKFEDFLSLNQKWFEIWKKDNSFTKQGVSYINKKALIEMNSNSLLLQLLEGKHFNYEMCKEINNSLEAQAGKMFLSNSHEVLIDREYLLVRQTDHFANTTIPLSLKYKNLTTPYGSLVISQTQLSQSIFDLDKNKNRFIINPLQIKGPLTIRPWQHGDYFQPFGMNGKHKKVSDLLSDLKFSKFEKERVMILMDGSEIMWVIGIRGDERYRIQESGQNSELTLIEWRPNLF